MEAGMCLVYEAKAMAAHVGSAAGLSTRTQNTCAYTTCVLFESVVCSLPSYSPRALHTITLRKCKGNVHPGPPLWSSGQSFWLQIQRSRVRSPALPDFLSSSGSGTGSTQPREVN